ncbi:MAG: FeoB-associated Cys-rich membrane protein [Treponema sp.]|nr:FeoB-associated Cys-rich membrane protein [Treponema sp.]
MFGTLLVSMILLALVAGVITSMVKAKRAGQHPSCGGHCASCGGACHAMGSSCGCKKSSVETAYNTEEKPIKI